MTEEAPFRVAYALLDLRKLSYRNPAGNVVVQKYRGTASESSRASRVSASLRLRKTNQSRIVDLENPALRGQVRAISDRVKVSLLSYPAYLSQPKNASEEVALATLNPMKQYYEVEGIRGTFIQLSNGEYFQRELQASSEAFAWSVALPAREIAQRLLASDLTTSTSNLGRYKDESPGFQSLDSRDLLERVEEGAKCRFFRAEFDAFSFTWRMPRVKHQTLSAELGEAGVIARSLDAGPLVPIVQQTATPDVGACAYQLLQETLLDHA